MKRSAISCDSQETKCVPGVRIKKEVIDEKIHTSQENRSTLSLSVLVKSGVKRKKTCSIDLARDLIDHHAMVSRA